MLYRKKRAFTLVEILIASALMAVFMIAVTKMWSKMNTGATRGMWKSAKEKELRYASKIIQDSISAATLPSIIVAGSSGGTFFVNSGSKVDTMGGTIPIDYLITYQHGTAPSVTNPFIDQSNGNINNIYIAIYGTAGFEAPAYDRPLGYMDETINRLGSGGTAVLVHPNPMLLAGAVKVLHWVEAKPSILGDNGTVTWCSLELQPSKRGTYKLVHRKYTVKDLTDGSMSSRPGGGSARTIVDSVVRMEIAAYPLPNDPRLSDCCGVANNQYFKTGPGGAVITTARTFDSSNAAPYAGAATYAANHIDEKEAEVDVRRNFMLYIKIGCAMKGKPSDQNKLYSAESMQIKTNLYVLPMTAIDQSY